jgi:hypothetical protein
MPTQKLTPGRRVYPNENGQTWFREGDYGRDDNGEWAGRPPGFELGTFEGHTVIEHKDGTITVEPSILVTYPREGLGAVQWHGYLQAGIWKELVP